jgi:hypothetical protein
MMGLLDGRQRQLTLVRSASQEERG